MDTEKKVRIKVWRKGYGHVDTSDYDEADERIDGHEVFEDIINDLEKEFGEFILNDVGEDIEDLKFEYEEIERHEEGEWNGPDDCSYYVWYRVEGDISGTFNILLDTDDVNDPRIKEVLNLFDDKEPSVEVIDW